MRMILGMLGSVNIDFWSLDFYEYKYFWTVKYPEKKSFAAFLAVLHFFYTIFKNINTFF